MYAQVYTRTAAVKGGNEIVEGMVMQIIVRENFVTLDGCSILSGTPQLTYSNFYFYRGGFAVRVQMNKVT